MMPLPKVEFKTEIIQTASYHFVLNLFRDNDEGTADIIGFSVSRIFGDSSDILDTNNFACRIINDYTGQRICIDSTIYGEFFKPNQDYDCIRRSYDGRIVRDLWRHAEYVCRNDKIAKQLERTLTFVYKSLITMYGAY